MRTVEARDEKSKHCVASYQPLGQLSYSTKHLFTDKPFSLFVSIALYKAQEHRLSSYLETPMLRPSKNSLSSDYGFSMVKIYTQVPYIKTSVS